MLVRHNPICLAAFWMTAALCCQASVRAAGPEAANPATLVVAHKWHDSIGFYDVATGAVRQTISIGRRPHEMVVTPDGRLAYITLYGIDYYHEKEPGGRAVAILDLESRAKVGEIDLGKHRRPHGIVLGEKTGRLYVTCDLPASLLVLDPQTRSVVASIALSNSEALPHMVAVTSDETTAFVANCGTGTLSVIDLEQHLPVQEISIGGVPMGLVLTADGSTLFATNRTANGVAVVDVKQRKIRRIIEIAGQPVRVHLTPDERSLLVTLIDSGELAVVDPKALTLERRLPIGRRVEGLQVDPTGHFGFASAQADNKVVKFSLIDFRVLLEIKTEERPDPMLILPLTPRISKVDANAG